MFRDSTAVVRIPVKDKVVGSIPTLGAKEYSLHSSIGRATVL